MIALQNDAAKNSLWRSAAVNTPRNGSSASTQNKGKASLPMPSCKRSHGSIGERSHGRHVSFRDNGSKGISNRKIIWGHLKDAKANFKSPYSKSYISDKKVKHERATTSSKSYDLWNKAKAKLTDDEFNKSRRTHACINCDEVGHTFYNCPNKPKP